MPARPDLDDLIASGDRSALQVAARESAPRLVRRITARLYSPEPYAKWQAVLAMGAIAADGGLPLERLKGLVQRFLWAMSDESGMVPYGVPEALGQILAERPELRGDCLPLLVSWLVHEEVVQTGKILAGAIWAIGRVGLDDPAEWTRVVPGLRSALTCSETETCGCALWTAGRLGAGNELRPEVLSFRDDGREVCLLRDGRIETCTLAALAHGALSAAGAA